MKIGFALPLGYLAGGSDSFAEFYGPPENCLAELQDNGVEIIEVGSYGHGASADDLLVAGKAVMDAGLEVSLHGYLPFDVRGSELVDVYPNHFPLLERLNEHQEETMVVLHGHSKNGPGDAVALADSTKRSLVQLLRIIRTQNLPVRVALEIMRRHPTICDPCTTYQGLLDIAKNIGGPEIGFCWDIGHTLSSVAQYDFELEPPPEFLDRVIHAHVHGVAPDGDTHWPLSEDPLMTRSLGKLIAAGYQGVYNLELFPARWPPAYVVRDKVLESIQRLREQKERLHD